MAQSEKTLAAKTRDEDRCFEENWRVAHRALHRRALRLTRGNQDEAEDLLSITAIKSLEILRRIPDHIHNPQGFFFLVLCHVHLDDMRRNTREKRIFNADATRRMEEEGEEIAGEAEAARTPLDTLLIMERLEDISRAVYRLSPPQRQLFDLVFIGECAYPEIAEILGISAMLARKRVQLLRERLRRLTKSSRD
jgi:RNA polymerase sigma-70 factor (ECF subfamily)